MLNFKLSKTQIDRLGDRLRADNLLESDLKVLDDYRRRFGKAYKDVVRTIPQQLQLQPTGRPAKSTTSLVEKLRRESIRLTQVQDIAGCRVVVHDIGEQDRVVASLRKLFPQVSVVDRRAKPQYGYRAVHVVVKIGDKLIEVQVRTALQHLWAELSEKFSDVVDPAIKYGGGDDQVRTLLKETSELVSEMESIERSIIGLGGEGLPLDFQEKTARAKDRLVNLLGELISSIGTKKG